MSTDFRALLGDLADSVPYTGDDISLADRSYAAGRRRRRVRHLEISSAAAVVVLIALFAGLLVGSVPLAAQYGTSGGTVVHGYPRQVGAQWPVLDLPARPGPLAALIGTDNGWDAVSPSGHRWHLPGVGTYGTPTLSADGRMLGDMGPARKGVGDGHGRYQVVDLVTGKHTTFAQLSDAYTCNCEPNSKAKYGLGGGESAVFSADDRYEAVGPYLLEIETAQVIAVPMARGVGWAGHRLVTLGGTATTRRADSYDLHGVRVSSTPLPNITGNPALSPDGHTLALVSGGRDGIPAIYRLDLDTGQQVGQPVPVLGASTRVLGYDQLVALPTLEPSGGSSFRGVVGVAADGSRHTLITFSGPATDTPDFVLATGTLSGTARGPLVLDRISSFIDTHHTAIIWAAVVLVLLIALRLRVAAHLRQWATEKPNLGYVPWSWRRRLLVLLLVTAVGAVAARELIAPAATGDLTSADAPVWWSAIDTAHQTGSADNGYPLTLTPIRSGQQQGFAVRVTNPTWRSQDVLGPPGNQPSLGGITSTLTMSTADGSSGQARSLRYGPPGTIPAHQSRWIRVLWVSTICMQSGTSDSLPTLDLRVQLGWVTRTEPVGLSPQVGLKGPSQPEPTGSTTACAGQS